MTQPRVILVHGFNVRDGGAGSLRPAKLSPKAQRQNARVGAQRLRQDRALAAYLLAGNEAERRKRDIKAAKMRAYRRRLKDGPDPEILGSRYTGPMR